MIKIQVINTTTGQKYGAKFKTEEEANNWTHKHQRKETWGRNTRVVEKFPITYAPELVSAEFTENIELPNGDIKEVLMVRLQREYEVILSEFDVEEDVGNIEAKMRRKVAKHIELKEKCELASDYILVTAENVKEYRLILDSLRLLKLDKAIRLLKKDKALEGRKRLIKYLEN